jgi:peroxiredoxin
MASREGEQVESLRQILAELQHARDVTWKQSALDANIGQRRELAATFDPKKAVQVGDKVEPFELHSVDGGTVTLDDLVRNGPAVFIFFRFAGCPVCNLSLAYYQRNLWPYLSALGIPLVAISPQIPQPLRQIKVRNALTYTVASDSNNQLGRRWGVTFETNKISQNFYATAAASFPQILGTGTWELPMPSVIIVDQQRKVRFVDIAPDWFMRTEGQVVLDALRPLLLAN